MSSKSLPHGRCWPATTQCRSKRFAQTSILRRYGPPSRLPACTTHRSASSEILWTNHTSHKIRHCRRVAKFCGQMILAIGLDIAYDTLQIYIIDYQYNILYRYKNKISAIVYCGWIVEKHPLRVKHGNAHVLQTVVERAIINRVMQKVKRELLVQATTKCNRCKSGTCKCNPTEPPFRLLIISRRSSCSEHTPQVSGLA